MKVVKVAAQVIGVVLLVLAQSSSTQANDPCHSFLKQVSVDGGQTWYPADLPSIAPSQVAGGSVEYRFILTNCLDNKYCVNTRVSDPTLGVDALVGDGVLAPGQQVIVTKDTSGFENLDQPGRCDTPGLKENIARETTEIEGSGVVETFADEAYVDCLPPDPPDIDIEKFTNGYDADNADGFPVPTPPSGGFAIGAPQVPLIAVGSPVSWAYVVTNNGAETLVNVFVSDSEGVSVSCPQDVLDPGESMTCLASGTALDLSTDLTATIVEGCGAMGQGMTQPTYENFGRVVARGQTSGIDLMAEDPSHYCNPPTVTIEKFTNGHDGDDADGSPSPAQGSFNVGGTTVAEIPSGSSVLWTYRVTNNGPEALQNVVVNDSRNVLVSCPKDTLAPGESINCTATGSAADLVATGGDVNGCSAQGQGTPRPTYENLGTVEARGTTSGILVEDDDPSHYCNPEPPADCGLTVGKTCAVPPPPPSPGGKCDGRLTQFSMVWAGPSGIQVSGPANDASGTVNNGDVVTFFGPFADNDVIVGISGALSGQSTFHTSCSDPDMDGDTSTNDAQQQVSSVGRDCGKFEGDGKGNNGNINQWLLEGFVDKEGAVLDCTPAPTNGATSCSFTPGDASCDTLGKPSNLTLVYSGGGCPGNNTQGSKTDCSGSVDSGLPATVTLDGGTLGTVNPGESFIVPTTGSNTTVVLSNAGGTQTNDIHTSCSAPLAAGDVFGAVTLAALDGVGIGSDIVYEYVVSNQGASTVSNITVDDDQLGFIGGIGSLAPGESGTLSATAFISATTTNVATVDGAGPPGAQCVAQSNPVVVTVLPPPPCSASIVFKEVKDEEVKWKLTNNSGKKATMETFLLNFPSGFGAIKEIELDGDVYKKGDSNTYPNGVGSGQLVGPNDWTESKVSKRELDPGETRELKVKFTNKFKNASPSDFGLTVTFKEGCMVAF